jgi:hypothetical protein
VPRLSARAEAVPSKNSSAEKCGYGEIHERERGGDNRSE